MFRKKPPRPFELHRDGIVLSEGAGAVVLEELSQAEERNATNIRRSPGLCDRPRRC